MRRAHLATRTSAGTPARPGTLSAAPCGASIRQHTHTPAYASIRQQTHTSAYVSIRQHARVQMHYQRHLAPYAGTQITCFTGAKVQILTLQHTY
jgi:hypothetical protein